MCTVGTAVISGRKLFVTIFDNAAAPEDADECNFTRPDPDLKHYRGGPYVSSDGGVTFESLFERHSFTGVVIRCPGVSPRYSTSNFINIAVDPHDPDHLFLGGWGAGQGVHELRTGKWVYWDACNSTSGPSSSEAPYGCFEGRRPDSMILDYNTYTFAFGVDWDSTEQRVITDGVVMPTPPSPATRLPLVYFTTSRGGIRVAWDPVNQRRSYKHMNNDLVNLTATPPRWSSTGATLRL